MRRIARHLTTLCAALSLVLCVTACAAWVRSHFGAESIWWVKHQGSLPPPNPTFTSLSLGWRSGGLELRAQHVPGAIFLAMDSDAEGFSYLRSDGPPDYPRLVPNDPARRSPLLLPGDWYGRAGPFEALLSNGRSSTGDRYVVNCAVVPLWAVALASLPLPIVRIARWRRRRGRQRGGLCPACGYDLRATPGRCPEC